jgi:hypothetical protein
MNWSNIFNNNFGRINYGGGNYGAVQASYGGNTQILPDLNTQSTDSRYGASFGSGGNPGGWGGNSDRWGNPSGWGGNSDRWGNPGGFGNQSYHPQPQPYDDFLRNGINPSQNSLLYLRDRRRIAEFDIGNIGREGGFFGNFAYPRSMYGLG